MNIRTLAIAWISFLALTAIAACNKHAPATVAETSTTVQDAQLVSEETRSDAICEGLAGGGKEEQYAYDAANCRPAT